jgi:hypothetical protein
MQRRNGDGQNRQNDARLRRQDKSREVLHLWPHGSGHKEKLVAVRESRLGCSLRPGAKSGSGTMRAARGRASIITAHFASLPPCRQVPTKFAVLPSFPVDFPRNRYDRRPTTSWDIDVHGSSGLCLAEAKETPIFWLFGGWGSLGSLSIDPRDSSPPAALSCSDSRDQPS